MSETQVVVEVEKSSDERNQKFEKILSIAAKHRPMFPLKKRDKLPLIAGWQKQATTDPVILREWFEKYPNCNWGTPTGAEFGIFVVDKDGAIGEQSASALGELLTPTLTQITGKGRHLIYRHPGIEIPNSVGTRLGPGIDVRGEGGFIVIEPSTHANGTLYRMEDINVPIALAPAALIERITGRKASAHDAPLDLIPQGERNNAIFRLVCGLFDAQMTAPDVLNAALLLNTVRCVPPLPESEVKTIVASAAKYPHPPKESQSKRRNPLYWFSFNVPDFFSDQAADLLEDYALGWHLRLVSFAWIRAGVLPADPAKLFRLARANSRKKFLAEYRDVLFEFEPSTLDGQAVLVNRRLANEYADALEKWLQQKEAGRARQEKLKSEKDHDNTRTVATT